MEEPVGITITFTAVYKPRKRTEMNICSTKTVHIKSLCLLRGVYGKNLSINEILFFVINN